MGSQSPDDTLPYWQVNVPPAQRTAECPDFLRSLSAKDRRIIGTPQADYAVMTWPEVRAIVAANQLDRFQRDPMALRRYLAYGWQLKQQYGSAVSFVLRERLHWPPDPPADTPVDAGFADPSGVKVLCNDWPYGIDGRIVHLVVWTKFRLPEDLATGDLTDEARAAIAAYVNKTFGSLPAENVCPTRSYGTGTSSVANRLGRPSQRIWFKNWASLKSVLLVEHFHVMLYDPPAALVDRLTGGDVPLSKRLEEKGSEQRGSA